MASPVDRSSSKGYLQLCYTINEEIIHSLFPHIIQDAGISWMTVCNLKWVFFLMHQAWFLAVPLAAMALDAERGNKPPGSDLALDVWTKVKTQVEDSRKRIA